MQLWKKTNIEEWFFFFSFLLLGEVIRLRQTNAYCIFSAKCQKVSRKRFSKVSWSTKRETTERVCLRQIRESNREEQSAQHHGKKGEQNRRKKTNRSNLWFPLQRQQNRNVLSVSVFFITTAQLLFSTYAFTTIVCVPIHCKVFNSSPPLPICSLF